MEIRFDELYLFLDSEGKVLCVCEDSAYNVFDQPIDQDKIKTVIRVYGEKLDW